MKLNHSRYIDTGAKDIADGIWRSEREKPTAKQVKFFTRLIIMCNENDIKPQIPGRRTRFDAAQSIDMMISLLKGKGVDVGGNRKKAEYGVVIGEDKRGRLYTGTLIMIEEEQE